MTIKYWRERSERGSRSKFLGVSRLGLEKQRLDLERNRIGWEQ